METSKINTIGRKGTTGFLENIKSSKQIQCYLLIGLPIIGFFMFTIYPIIWAFIKAFYYYDQIPSNTMFVGLKNFKDAFSDVTYWRSWLVTFKFLLWKLPIEILLALVLATILGRNTKFGDFFRTVYYFPCLISTAVAAVIFSNIFKYYGVFNSVLLSLGLTGEAIDWFSTANGSLAVLVITNMWSSFGINVLYFSAAITNVPNELYEASELDGAGAVRQFINITVPAIKPVFKVILLLAINGTLQIGEYVLLMTGGAPAGTTHTVGSFMIQNYVPGFAEAGANIGYGCALAIINSIVYGIVAIIYMKSTKNMNEV